MNADVTPCPSCNGQGFKPLESLAEARGVDINTLVHQVQTRTLIPASLLPEIDLQSMTYLCLFCQGSGTRVENKGQNNES